jgi:hypothetical protein
MAVEDELASLASWSPWVAFEDALATAPTQPGVYMARDGATCEVVYVGMAGERRGRSENGKPRGLRGRLAVYASGKALASGLGEAVLDRALADAEWLRGRVTEVEEGHPTRAKGWGRMAFERSRLQVRWATAADRSSARSLELAVLSALADTELWNRAR